MNGEVGAWSCNVSEYATGAAKHVVLNGDSFVNGYVVLYPDAIAYVHIVANVDVLPEGTIGAYSGSFLNMAEMPYLCVVTYLNIIINITAFMYKCLVHCWSIL